MNKLKKAFTTTNYIPLFLLRFFSKLFTTKCYLKIAYYLHFGKKLNLNNLDYVYGISNLHQLEDLIITSRQKTVKTSGISNCCNLKKLSFPKEITTFELNAINDLPKLTEVEILGENIKFGVGNFKNCPNLKEIKVRDKELFKKLKTRKDTKDKKITLLD